MEFKECPICKSKTLAEIKPVAGTDYCIPTIDNNSVPPVMLPAGFKVKLMGCVTCKCVIPMFDTSALENA